MSLLWDYEEKTHRIIAGRKRKKVQKRIVAAVNDGYEVESSDLQRRSVCCPAGRHIQR